MCDSHFKDDMGLTCEGSDLQPAMFLLALLPPREKLNLEFAAFLYRLNLRCLVGSCNIRCRLSLFGIRDDIELIEFDLTRW